MIENNDFIQLPPIKKDTPSEVVSMIWQYLKLPEVLFGKLNAAVSIRLKRVFQST